MKNLVVVCVLTASLSANAQQWACKSVYAAGLGHSTRGWNAARFEHDDLFSLTGYNKSVTDSSVRKALDVSEYGEVHCERDHSLTFCMDKWNGNTFSFNSALGQGIIARTFGALANTRDPDGYHDSVIVTPFECVSG